MARKGNEPGIGIVGCGVISQTYLENASSYPGIRLVACTDILPDAAKAKAAAFGIDALPAREFYARDDIDIVVNLTPPLVHHEVSLAALMAGKHVFSEKPLSVETGHGRELVAEAAKRGLKIGCAPDTFLGAGGRLARELVDAGTIGKVLSGTFFIMSRGMEHWHPDPEFFFKHGGGPLLDIGPYYLTTLVNLLGPVESVQASTSTGFAERLVTSQGPRNGARIAVETPTNIHAIIRLVSGADIILATSWDVWKHGHPPIELYGTEGTMRVPDPNFYGGAVEYTARGGDWVSVSSAAKPFGKPNWRSPFWPPAMPMRENYRCLGVADLASAISEGTPHRASGELANHVLEIMQGILEAGRAGTVVKVVSRVERPAVWSDADAARLWRGAAG